MKLPYVIAEIGVNYYDTAKIENISPLDAAKRYIYEAAKAGVSAVKFQTYKAETIASKNSAAYWDLNKEATRTQYELFSKFDSFGRDEYYQLYLYAKAQGVDFMSTPFDYASVDYLDEMLDIYKISSSDITNLPFIRYIAKKKKPIYLSVGASYLSEIDEAVRVMLEEGCKDICLLHCVLSYPCRNSDANLNKIKALKRVFTDIKVGYSDHTLPDETMTILTTAYLFGAEVIEKHFTLDKTLKGNDHYHAGDPKDFRNAISNFKTINEICGKEEITVYDCEKIPRKEARRSLVLNRDMKQGEVIGNEDIVAKRPGIGIGPKYMDIVIGKTIKKDLPEDTILTWDMLI